MRRGQPGRGRAHFSNACRARDERGNSCRRRRGRRRRRGEGKARRQRQRRCCSWLAACRRSGSAQELASAPPPPPPSPLHRSTLDFLGSTTPHTARLNGLARLRARHRLLSGPAASVVRGGPSILAGRRCLSCPACRRLSRPWPPGPAATQAAAPLRLPSVSSICASSRPRSLSPLPSPPPLSAQGRSTASPSRPTRRLRRSSGTSRRRGRAGRAPRACAASERVA
jgi:hypothetical protein